MVPRLGDIHDRIEIRRLAGGSQHCGKTALQVTDLRCHCVICRVLEPCVEIAGLLKVKESAHLLAARIAECGALIDRKHPRLAVARLIPGLDAFCLNSVIAHLCISSCLSSVQIVFYSFQLWYTSWTSSSSSSRSSVFWIFLMSSSLVSST